MFRPQPISSTDARKYFSQIINKVQFSSKSFVVQSYRRPAVRIVKEEYIAILEQVLGKKTVGQILQVSGNDNMREAAKAQEIRKILQRRLSGAQRSEKHPQRSQSQQKPKPRPPQPRPRDDRPLTGKRPASSLNLPAGKAGPQASGKRVLLLSNGKNYK